MARRKTKTGTCQICGRKAKLSFEHVPPRAAFNDTPVVSPDIDDLLDNWFEMKDSGRGRVDQLGAGGYTLCEQCNNITGSWYGRGFVSWTKQIANCLAKQQNKEIISCDIKVYPLRIIKQIICMFFSATGDRFRNIHQELVRFVLNKEDMQFKKGIKIYTFITTTPVARQSGVAGTLNIKTRESRTFSEISFPPLGYMMALSSKPPHEKLVDISDFAFMPYNELREFSIKLPVLPTISPFPGDFRTEEELEKIYLNSLV